MARLADGLIALAVLLAASPARADGALPARFRALHELRAQDDGDTLGLSIRSTYALTGEPRVAFASPVCTSLEIVAPAGTTVTRDASGCATGALVPAGQRELVLSSSQRVRRGEETRLAVPLLGDRALELVVISGGDGAQIEPSAELGMVRHVGYLASASVTDDESAAFGSWRLHQPLRQQYILVRADRDAPSLAGRVTTKESRTRPFLAALVGVTLVGLLVLVWLRRRLERAAIGEEAEVIIAQHSGERP